MTDKNHSSEGEPHGGSAHQEWLVGRRDSLSRERALYRRLEARWSWARLVAFVAGVIVVILVRHSLLLTVAAAGAGLAVFAGIVLRHMRWEEQRACAERVLVVIAESLHASTRRDRPARSWQRPQDPTDPSITLANLIDSGPTWPLTNQERDDLDLYAPPTGIFGLLNRTSTDLGARRLRDMLDNPCLSHDGIQQRQQAVEWLARQGEQRLGLMGTAVLLRGRFAHLDRLIRLLRETKDPPRSSALTAIRGWSVVSGLLFLHAILRIGGGQFEWIRAILALLTLNIAILILFRRPLARLNAAVSPWTGLQSTLSSFLAVAQHAGRDLPGDGLLGVLKHHFHELTQRTRIPSLCTWLDWAGLHGIMRGLLNTLVFLDLHIADAVLARVVPSREVFLCGLSAMAELEALYSLACFSAEQPVACYPRLAAETSLSIEDGRHPLILESEITPNGIHLTPETRTWVVTGPNAAGKSTFLRMAGVNVLLAQTGAAVAAREMTWSPVRLITDVRVRDDLASHESYFLSEVRRLRRLVLDADDGLPMLGLIDEPFRGTNSQERTAAAVALLEYLMAANGLFLVATHEEILAQVATGSAAAANYHFQEHLHDGGIVFDYRLRPGPATTRTALRILEQEGYPQALLQRARRLMLPTSQGNPSAASGQDQ